MYFVGIDISKYKHDCFILNNETGEVICDNFSFTNNKEGFNQLLILLNKLDNKNQIRIGFEATGHYGINLKLFLEKNNYSFMEFNSRLVKNFSSGQTLRKTKTDKVDARGITKYLMSTSYKPHPKLFYHNYSLKSLSRLREKLIKQRSLYKVQLTNILDITFPELKPFFNNCFSATFLFVLKKYKTAEKISKIKDFDSIKNVSRGKFTYTKFTKLKELAKNTVGESNDIFTLQLNCILNLYFNIDNNINSIESEITNLITELNPQVLTIKGIGPVSAASIFSEFGDISRFSSPHAMLAFAGLEPSVIESGTSSFTGRMVKRGSGNLRYTLMNVALSIIKHEPIFYDYYNKKRSEGKPHRVALTHVCKKLIRVIYKLEISNIPFDSSKLI